MSSFANSGSPNAVGRHNTDREMTHAAPRQSRLSQRPKNCGSTLTAEEEEVARTNSDAVFEFACRFIVMRSLPGWMEEIYAEHLQSTHSLSKHSEEPGDPAFLASVQSLLQIGVLT